MPKQKEKNTLLNTVSQLKRNEIIKYASNLGFDIDESLDDSQLGQVCADWLLANPEELMTRLPMGDLRTLQEIRDHRDPEPPNYFNNYLTPVMVKYGLVRPLSLRQRAEIQEMPWKGCEVKEEL